MYTHQVNFEKVFLSGILKGVRCHDRIKFVFLSDAIFFSKRDGLIVTPVCGTSVYRQENSRIIDLKDRTPASPAKEKEDVAHD